MQREQFFNLGLSLLPRSSFHHRRRCINSEQGLKRMADCNQSKPTSSSFFTSPKLLSAFSFLESDSAVMSSPTSILDSKPSSAFRTPFWSDASSPKTSSESEHRRHWDKLESRGVGLAIVDALKDEKSCPILKRPESRMVLFGSQLKIQIPPLPPSVQSPVDSPKSARDFGIKTKSSQLGFIGMSPSSVKISGFGSSSSGLETAKSPRVFEGCLSATEMELSEDYTRVIAHGPNPRTTHIFDNCIIDSCCGIVGFSASRKQSEEFDDRFSYPSQSFLSFCCTCRKSLEHGKDIYIYRGEKAFCSSECRYQEMMLEEKDEKMGI